MRAGRRARVTAAPGSLGAGRLGGLLVLLGSACTGGASAVPLPVASSDGGADTAEDGAAGADAAGPDGSSPEELACQAAAVADCAKLESCVPILFGVLYGNRTKCEEREGLTCLARLTAVKGHVTTVHVDACAAAIGAATCGRILEREISGLELPECIPPPGDVANGRSCGDSAQCASGRCKLVDSCGGCAVPGRAGQPCDRHADCDNGLVCVGFACRVPAEVNQSCTDDAGCRGNLVCGRNGRCATPMPAGVACDPAFDICDLFGAGAVCHPETAVCTKIELSPPGGDCGIFSNGDVALCAGGSCGDNGICVEFPGDGAYCDLGTPSCMAPAFCTNVFGGICQLPNPNSCL